jgi:hypothetical protein
MASIGRKACPSSAGATTERSLSALDSGSWKPGTDELAPLVTAAICSQRFVLPGQPADPETSLSWSASHGVPRVGVTRGPRSILANDRGGRFEIATRSCQAVGIDRWAISPARLRPLTKKKGRRAELPAPGFSIPYSLPMVSSAGMPTTPAMPAAGVPATAEAMRGRVPSAEPAGVAAAEGVPAAKALRMSSAAKPVEPAI